MCIFFLTLVTPMSKDWTSFGSAGALVSPPRRFKLETPIWSWNVAVFPSGSVGSLAWKLQTTREVSTCKDKHNTNVQQSIIQLPLAIEVYVSMYDCIPIKHYTLISRSRGSQVVRFLENSRIVNPFSSSPLIRNQS